MLSTQTDGVLVVADAGKTRRAAARRTVDNLRKVGANLIGVTVNRLSPRGPGRYHQYYYYYHNSAYAEGKSRRRRKKSKA